ncbi:hypothetical protein Q673_01575 [Marinobacter sp. EN3]|uniref:tyrosine-type recombinase/integrase n=1 Tax=Marinobacter sp. EN3 TaxID=1397533 RepID=UPI0003B9004C|nr:tyrosine-type recombinase/integrase [Marinobacter sp. EN3]ERS12330.1 hypothetical protein Q673_01575 [Marinobacter sp. EN3]
MARKSASSITDTAMRKHLTNDAVAVRAELSCDYIPGFFLMKGKTGGTWNYRYRDADGKKRVFRIGNIKSGSIDTAGIDPRHMSRTTAISEAEKWQGRIKEGEYPHTIREAQKQEARQKDQELKRAAESTLGKFLEGPFAANQSRKKGQGKHTINIIRSNFEHLLERPLDGIRAADIKEWQHDKEAEGKAYSTLKRAFGALRTLMNQAVADGVLQEMPFTSKALAPQRADLKEQEIHRQEEEARKKRRMLTDTELDALWRGLELYDKQRRQQRANSRKHGKDYLPDLSDVRFVDWFEPAVTLAYFTGIRPGDLYGLRWPNIHFAEIGGSRLRFVPEKTRHHADPAQVDIMLHPDAEEVIRAWWIQCGKPDSGYVFTEKDGVRLGRQAHDGRWSTVKTLGGLPEEIEFYSLRHHFISNLLDKGQPMKLVAEAVGHKSTAMIERNYGHILPERKDEAMKLMAGRRKVAPQKNKTIENAKAIGRE